jgi:nitroreductase
MTTELAPTVDLLDGIMTLRALRRLKPDAIEPEIVWKILAAGNQAPSGGNIQPWQFLVVDDPAVKAPLGDLYRTAYARYEAALLPGRRPSKTEADERAWQRTIDASRHLAANFEHAPIITFVLGADIDLMIKDDEGPLDIGSILGSVFPSVQNLMLAARSFGIGCALTTVLRIDQAATKALLNIPDRWQVIAAIPMGYPEGRFGVAPRKPVERVTHWNHFGEQRPRD